MVVSQTSRRRAVLTSVVAFALVAVGPAALARTKPKPKPKPKPVCDLVSDPRGNEGWIVPGVPSSQAYPDPSLDILSADIASNATYMTAAIRVAKLTIPDPNAPAGVFYKFAFTNSADQEGKYLQVRIAPKTDGSTDGKWAPVWQDGSQGTGVIDTVHNEIRITLPLSYFGSGAHAILPSSPLTTFTVTADWPNSGVPGVTVQQPLTGGYPMGNSVVNTTAKYIPGTLSCVPVGH